MTDYNFAPLIINSYIWNELGAVMPSLTSKYTGIEPIYPVYDSLSAKGAWNGLPYIIYDNMLMSKISSFYGIKREQTVYSIRGNVPEIFKIRNAIIDIIDRSDDAAKDINEYAGQNLNNVSVFFHEFSAFQLDFTNEKTIANSTRQLYTTELILEYEYHNQSIYNQSIV